MKQIVWQVAVLSGLLALPGKGAVELNAEKVQWAEKIKIKGDARYRYEMIDEEGKDTRERNRIRVRAGIEAEVNPNVKAVVQIATDQGNDPISRNQTMTEGFTGKGIYLDLGYAEWTFSDQLKASGGKIKNPFINVTDLVWDGDLTPEGIAANAKLGSDENIEVLMTGGYLWVFERSGESDDTMLYAGQAAVKLHFTPEIYLLAGGTCYGYDNMEGYDVIDWEKKNNSFGNSTKNKVSGGVTNKQYATDFTLVEGFAEFGVWVGLPVRLIGDYVINTDADANDTGYQGGVAVGKAKNPKTYEVGYAYVKIEKDAVVGAFTDSDRWGGGTDGQGHKLSGKYQIARNWQFGVTYFINEKPISDAAKTHDYDRLQADFVASF